MKTETVQAKAPEIKIMSAFPLHYPGLSSWSDLVKLRLVDGRRVYEMEDNEYVKLKIDDKPELRWNVSIIKARAFEEMASIFPPKHELVQGIQEIHAANLHLIHPTDITRGGSPLYLLLKRLLTFCIR